MNTENIKVAVLLEHYEGEENWTASIPVIPGCLAEAPTPEAAAQAIIPEIEFFTSNDPAALEAVQQQPEFLLTEVEIPIPTASSPQMPDKPI
ncbi:MAG: hypothetical protein HY431_02840 [Candidatus Levybacteria bacterium]|nr:hypothetical protein [Candidatus Levybacteria bacterium]